MNKVVTDDLFYKAVKETMKSKQWKEENEHFANEMVKQYFELHHLNEDGATVSEEQMADAKMIKTICKNVAYAIAPSIVASTFDAIAKTGITNLRQMNDDEKHLFDSHMNKD